MKTIYHYSTLFYYDGPQVFEARDAIGGHYIAMMVNSELPGVAEHTMQEQSDRYLVTGVKPDRLRLFRAGVIDLRSLLVESDRNECYMATAHAGIDEPLRLERLNVPLVENGFLPDPGFLLHNRPTDNSVLREARERNNLVIEIVAEPPEAASRHRIRVNTLAGILNRIQAVVKYAYRTAIKPLVATRITICSTSLFQPLQGHFE